MNDRVKRIKTELASIVREHCLEQHAVERLTALHPGDAIVCTRGILWVTQEGDPEDYLLHRGSAFFLKRKGQVVVQGLNSAAYRLSIRAQKTHWIHRLLRETSTP